MELIDVYHKLYSICTDASDNKVDLQGVINRVWNIAAEIREFENARPIHKRVRNFVVEELSKQETQTLESIFEQIHEARMNRMRRDDALIQLMKEKKEKGGKVWVLFKHGRLRDWGEPFASVEGVFPTHEDASSELRRISLSHDDQVDLDVDTWNYDFFDEEGTYEIEEVEVKFGDSNGKNMGD